MLASACSVPVKHKWENLKYYHCKKVLGTLLEQVLILSMKSLLAVL